MRTVVAVLAILAGLPALAQTKTTPTFGIDSSGTSRTLYLRNPVGRSWSPIGALNTATGVFTAATGATVGPTVCPAGARVAASGASIATEWAAMSTGGTLCLNGGTYTVSSTVTLNKAGTVLGVAGAAITSSVSSGSVFSATASDVSVQGLAATGPNRTTNHNNCGGYTAFVSASSVNNLTVKDNTATTFACHVSVVGGTGHSITNNRFNKAGYVGVAFNGVGTSTAGSGGVIQGNIITDVNENGSLIPGGAADNAYGIVMSVNGSTVTKNVLVDNNRVVNSPTWECIDTHDGSDITISNNYCFRPGRVGINAVKSGVAATTNITITNNVIEGPPADTNTGWINGIVLCSDACGSGNNSSGTISGNTVRGFPGGACYFAPSSTVGSVTVGSNTCTP